MTDATRVNDNLRKRIEIDLTFNASSRMTLRNTGAMVIAQLLGWEVSALLLVGVVYSAGVILI